VENIEQFLMDVKDSLEREIHGLGREMRGEFAQLKAEINTRFDTQAARLERHAGLWQTGSRWSGRMDIWAEKIDAAIEVKDREIAELRERLNKLERRPPS
jgi:hypothetical protein